MNIFELFATIGLNDEGFNSGIKEAGKSTSGLTSGVKGLISTVANIKLVSMAFDAVKNSVGSAFARIDTMEQFNRTMTVLTGSSDKASSALENIRQTVTGTAYGLDIAASSVQGFVTSGMDIDVASTHIEGLANAVSFYGDGTNTTLQSVTDAWGKMATSGKVYSIDVKTLLNAGIPAWSIYAEAVGMSVEEVQTATGNGTISAKEFQSTLISALETGAGQFPSVTNAAKEAGASWQGTFDNMQANTTRGVQGIILAIDGGLTEGSLPDLRSMLKTVGTGFEDFLNMVADGAGIFVKTVSPAIRLVGDNMKTILPIAGSLAAGFVTLKTAMGIKSTVNDLSTALHGIMRANTGALRAQELYSEALKKGNAVEVLSNALKDKSVETEGIRMAAKKISMSLDKDQMAVTAAGTAATEAESLAVLASSGALSAKQVIIGLVTKQIELSTAKTWLWKTAMSALPFVAVVAGIVAVVAAIKNWIDKSRAVSEETKELTKNVESNVDARKQDAETTIAEAEANKDLANELVNLSQKTNKTAGDISMMKMYADSLNKTLGENVVVIDEVTGAVNMSEDAIYSMIDAMIAEAKAAAYQEAIKEAYLDRIKLQKQLVDKTNELTEATTGSGAAYSYMGYAQKGASGNTQELENDIQLLKDAIEGTEEETKFYREAAKEAYDETAEASKESTDIQINSYEDLSEALQKSADTIIDSMGEIRDSSTSMTKQLELDSEITAQSVLDTLKNNQTMVSGYYDGLKTLMERGVQGSVIDILSDGSEESMSIVSAFKDATDEELQTLVESFETNAYLAGEGYKEYLLSTGMDEATANAIYDAYLAGNEASISADWGGIGSGAANEVVTNFEESANITPAVNGIVDPFGNLFNAALSNVGLSSGEALADQTGAGASGTSAALSSPLAQAVKTASDFAVNMASSVKPGLSQLNDSFTTSFTQLNSVVRNGMQSFSTMVTTATTSTFSKMVSTATNNMTTFKTNVVTKTSETATSVSNTLDNIVKTVTTWGASLATAGKDAAERLKSSVESTASTISLYQTGVDAVQGFINGASSQEGNLYNRMYNLFYQAKKAAANALDEHSPSRELAKSGINAVLGFIQGAVSRENELYDTMENMFSFSALMGGFSALSSRLANAVGDLSNISETSYLAPIFNAPYAGQVGTQGMTQAAMTAAAGGMTINQYLQSAPASAGEQADATVAAFRRARWAIK